MMLARRQSESVHFLGSAFLVHANGYLLTAAHLVTAAAEDLVVVATAPDDDFLPLTADRVTAMPVTVVALDAEHDVALLRIEPTLQIGVPDDFLGSTAAVRQGASVMALGYSFGHHQVHAAMATDAVVTAKLRSRNGTSLILYGAAFHEGDRGGPLVHVQDGHIIGVISGRFEPAEITRAAIAERAPGDSADNRLAAAESHVSYAVAIEYGLALMAGIPGLQHSP